MNFIEGFMALYKIIWAIITSGYLWGIIGFIVAVFSLVVISFLIELLFIAIKYKGDVTKIIEWMKADTLKG